MAVIQKSQGAKRTVRYAVVGLGNLAQTVVLPAFRRAKAHSELVALISGDAQKLEALGRKYRVSHLGTYDELEAVLAACGADAVYLVTPNTTHRALTERALAAGCHVLCEKPMAMRSVDCRAMIAAAKRHHRKLMIAYRLHFEPATVKALVLAKSGRLGKLRYFSSSFSHQIRAGDTRTRAAEGGGALFDLGPYPLNMARQLFGEPLEVVALQAFGVDARSKEVDEMTSALLRFEGERFAQFTVNQGAGSVSSYRVVGETGELIVSPGFSHHKQLVHQLTIGARSTRQAFPMTDQFAAELISFSRCVLEHREPECTGEEGLRDTLVLEAIIRSARTGRVVKLAKRQGGASPARKKSAIRRPPGRPVKPVRAPDPSK